MDYVTTTNGKQIDISSLEKTYTYDSNNNLSTISVTLGSYTYMQTFTWDETGEFLLNESQWELQV